MIIIEKITASRGKFLFIKVTENRIRAYVWKSESWEPMDAINVAGIVMSEESCIRGTLVPGKTSQSYSSDLLH